MCTVSMVGDHYREWFPQRYPGWFPDTEPSQPASGRPIVIQQPSAVSREEFDALKRDVEDMKALLIRAKDYDAKNGEPDCEMDDKVALLKRIADLVGVDLAEVFGAKA